MEFPRIVAFGLTAPLRLALWWVFVLSAAGLAQEAKLESATERPVVGRPFALVLTLRGLDGDTPVIEADGLETSHSGRQRKGGSRAGGSVVIHTYEAVALRPGRVVIPEIRIAGRGTEAKTAPLVIQVLAESEAAALARGKDAAPAFIEVRLARARAFVGEVLPLEVRLYLHATLRVRSVQNQRELSLKGESLIFQQIDRPEEDIEIVDGQNYQVFVFETAVTAAKPGNHEIEPFTIGASVIRPKGSRGAKPSRSQRIVEEIMGPDAFEMLNDMELPEDIRVQALPTPLEVAPLPEEGMPAGFAGAIGRFQLRAVADKVSLRVDEPLRVTVSLSGMGNFDRVREVPFHPGDEWRAYSQKSEFTAEDRLRLRGEKRFEQVFIPLAPTEEAPVFRFSYLDPEKKAYVEIQADPVLVRVTGEAGSDPRGRPVEINPLNER